MQAHTHRHTFRNVKFIACFSLLDNSSWIYSIHTIHADTKSNRMPTICCWRWLDWPLLVSQIFPFWFDCVLSNVFLLYYSFCVLVVIVVVWWHVSCASFVHFLVHCWFFFLLHNLSITCILLHVPVSVKNGYESRFWRLDVTTCRGGNGDCCYIEEYTNFVPTNGDGDGYACRIMPSRIFKRACTHSHSHRRIHQLVASTLAQRTVFQS